MGKVMYPFKHKMEDNFGQNLHRLRKQKGLTLEQLAIDVNKKYGTKINKGMISKWENGHSAELESVKVLSLYFDVTINELLGFNVKQSRNRIPIYEKRNLRNILKTDRTDMIPQEGLLGYSSIPEHIDISEADINRMFYIKMDDDFMDRECPKGSIVLIKETKSVNDGDNVLISINDDEDIAYFGRYKRLDNLIFLIPVSNNSKKTQIIIDKNKTDIEILGKSILCIHTKV